MPGEHEVFERLARVEQQVTEMNTWSDRYYKCLQTLDRRTQELHEDFHVWKAHESRFTRIISAVVAGIVAGIIAAAQWIWGNR